VESLPPSTRAGEREETDDTGFSAAPDIAAV
jgi:hypothetical protein